VVRDAKLVNVTQPEWNLRELRQNALDGDRTAVDELYRIALNTVPKKSADSRDQIIRDAIWAVLLEDTRIDDGELHLDSEMNVNLPKFRQKVLVKVAGAASDRTVDYFLKDKAKMLPIVSDYMTKCSRETVMHKAVWRVLMDATWDELEGCAQITPDALFIDSQLNITVPDFRSLVFEAVGGRLSEKTVDQYLTDAAWMHEIARHYLGEFSVWAKVLNRRQK
jgi:hypothetical protein